MATSGTRRERKPVKTWSLLGDVKKVPSTYEVVTSKFHYHFRREPAPFELDPETPINLWYLKYREGSAVQLEDWEEFRDPARLTYRDYVSLQDQHETYLDHLIDQAEKVDSARTMSPEWVKTVSEFLVPMRFPLHILQMVSIYTAQMAPTSFVTNCANFQAADEMRRIQRIAYWTKVLANTHDAELATTAYARDIWENNAAWQPMRKVLEELLIAYDWAESWVALDFVVKPAIDAMLNWQFADQAKANQDEFLSLMFGEFQSDSERNKAWTVALGKYILERDPSQAAVMREWIAKWRPAVEEACKPLQAMLWNDAASTVVSERIDAITAEAGL